MTDDVIGRAIPDAPAAFASLMRVPTIARARPGARWARTYVHGRRLTDLIGILIATTVIPVVGGFFPAAVGAPDPTKLALAATIALVWFTLLRIGPLPEVRRIVAERNEYRRVIIRSVALFGALAALSVAVVHVPAIRWDLVVVFPLGTAFILAGRAAWRRRLRAHRAVGRHLARAVIVGSSRDVESVAHTLASGQRAFATVGVVLTDTGDVSGLAEGTLSFTGTEAIADAVAIAGADTVVLAGAPNDGGVLVRDLAWRLESTPADLVLASSLEGIGASRLSFQPVDGLAVVHVTTPRFSGGKHHLKRGMDILFSGVALMLLAPVFAVIAALVRLDSRGPAMFRQVRVGRDGIPFTMYKFRSMKVDAESDLGALAALNEGNGLLFKLRNDPRVTRIGAVLRRYSLDELPQIWNVFRGDMSLVGPRPPLASEVARYDDHVHRRLYIKPGLTGPWQVSGRSDLSWEQSVRLDLFYVANWSPFGDLVIMGRTVRVVLRPTGAY